MWETLSFPLSLSLSFLMFATSNIYHQQQQQPPSLLTARAPTTTFTSFTRLLVCSLAVRWWRQAYTALLLLYVLYTHGASSAAAATFVEHLKIQEKHRQTDRQVRGVVCSIEHTHLRALYFRSLHLASPTEALRYPFLHQFVFVGTDSELEWSSIHSLYGGIEQSCVYVCLLMIMASSSSSFSSSCPSLGGHVSPQPFNPSDYLSWQLICTFRCFLLLLLS